MTTVLVEVQAHVVRTVDEALIVARIRNFCRGMFTHHNEVITAEQQREWWFEHDERWRLWLYGEPYHWVGFGLLKPDEEGRTWATLGVLPQHRGQGYGTAIYRHLIEQGEHVWIEIGKANPASYKAARRAGFMPVSADDTVLTLVASRGTASD